MPTMSRRLKNAVNLALFFGIALSALGQQKINPATQINWPASCTAATPLYNISTGVCVASTGQIVFTGPWSAFTTYGINEAVSFSGSQYVSIQNGNLNQDPATQTTYWALLFGGGSGMTQITGDIAAGPGTGSQVATLPNINGHVGTCGDATHVGQVTLNAKGQTTGCTPVSIAGASGFPITIGSTPVAASSTTTALAGLSVNGVTLDATGAATSYLDKTGHYSTPGGGVFNCTGFCLLGSTASVPISIDSNGYVTFSNNTSSGGGNGPIPVNVTSNGAIDTNLGIANTGTGGHQFYAYSTSTAHGDGAGVFGIADWGTSGASELAQLVWWGTDHVGNFPQGLRPLNVTSGNCLTTDSSKTIIDAGAPCGTGGGGGNTTSTALTTNKLPKANGANSIIDSSLSDDGTKLSSPEPLALGGASNGGAELTYIGSAVAAPDANSVQFTLDGAVPTPYNVYVPLSAPTGTNKYMNCAADPCIWDAGAGGGSNTIIGTATFEADSGSITNLTISGVVTSVSRTSAGQYVVNISGVPTNYLVMCSTASPGVAYVLCNSGLTFPLSSSSFAMTVFNASGLASIDPKYIAIEVVGQ